MSSHYSDLYQKYDETQVEMMKEEVLIVDENDVVTGPGSKKDSMCQCNVTLLTRSTFDGQHQ
jgi:hypothetical protein